MNEPVEVSVGDCAYLAALVDHNARIYVDRRKQRNGRLGFVLTLAFYGLGAETTSWLKSKFPGLCVVRKAPRYATFKACAVLVRAFSYLQSKTKIAQARLAFKLNEIKPSKGRLWTETDLELRAHLAEQIRKAAKPTPKIKIVPMSLGGKMAVARMTGG